MTFTLADADAMAAKVAVAPRVTLQDITDAVDHSFFFNAGAASELMGNPASPALDYLSVCIIVMKNGFTVVGKSAPASPENFNYDLGRKLAYDDAARQIWPLMGFALKDRLAEKARAEADDCPF